MGIKMALLPDTLVEKSFNPLVYQHDSWFVGKSFSHKKIGDVAHYQLHSDSGPRQCQKITSPNPRHQQSSDEQLRPKKHSLYTIYMEYTCLLPTILIISHNISSQSQSYLTNHHTDHISSYLITIFRVNYDDLNQRPHHR